MSTFLSLVITLLSANGMTAPDAPYAPLCEGSVYLADSDTCSDDTAPYECDCADTGEISECAPVCALTCDTDDNCAATFGGEY